MDELNGRMLACQILITGLVARVANSAPDPLRFLTDFRDEIKAVVSGINIAGMEETDRVRQTAQRTIANDVQRGTARNECSSSCARIRSRCDR